MSARKEIIPYEPRKPMGKPSCGHSWARHDCQTCEVAVSLCPVCGKEVCWRGVAGHAGRCRKQVAIRDATQLEEIMSPFLWLGLGVLLGVVLALGGLRLFLWLVGSWT